MIKVEGGGVTGQARDPHGIARALLELDPDHRLALRQAGSSPATAMKERKKYGLKRARKAPSTQSGSARLLARAGRGRSVGSRP